MCNRRWFFDHVREMRDTKGSAATDLGKEVHADIERALRDNQELSHPLLRANTFIDRVRRLARAGMEMRIEHEFYDHELPALGFIDLVLIDRPGKAVYIIDHKTSGNLKYIKTAAQLALDDQCLLYAYQLLREFGRGFRYFFGHHVIPTKTAGPEQITIIELDLFQIDAGRQAQIEYVAAMARSLDKAPGEIPKTESACFKFPPYGCPHKSYCNSSNSFSFLDEPMRLSSDPIIPVYLDCMPTRGPVVHWDVWVADLTAAYQKTYGEHYLMTKFNEGAKIMAAKAWETPVPAGLVLRSTDAAALLFSNLVRGDVRYELVVGVR